MRSALTIPNLLTLGRILLVVPVAYTLWVERVGWATALLVVAAVTDILDGFLARHFHWRTTLGAWLDPAADKILIATVLFTQTAKGDVPGWFCGVTVFRDAGLAVGTLGLLMMGVRVKIQPYLTGKLATMAQNVALIFSVFQRIVPAAERALPVLLAGSAALTILSSYWYAKAFSLILRRHRPAA